MAIGRNPWVVIGIVATLAQTAASQRQPSTCAATIGLTDPLGRPVEVVCGSYTVTASVDSWTAGRHYKIFGNLTVPAGKALDIRNSLVEIISDYPRQHQAFITGGRLSTSDTQIGGTARDGVWVQTIFNLQAAGRSSPRWGATNTTIQYSYGILSNAGTFEAWNLQQGPSPDALILGGTANATLHGSTFNVALGVDTRAGTDSVLDLPNRMVSATYSGSEPTASGRRLPGAQYRLELDRVTVPLWILFFQGVTTTASPKTTIRLGDVQAVVPSIQAVDFDGEMTLRSTWVNERVTWRQFVPAGSVSTAGNLVLRTESEGTTIPGWGVYLTETRPGATRAVIRGPTSIAELFTYPGTQVQVLGTPGTFDTLLAATTVELFANSSLLARNVTVGHITDRNIRGHIGVQGRGAHARFEYARYRDLTVVNHSMGTVLFTDSVPIAFPDGTQAGVRSSGTPPAFLRSALAAVVPAATLRNDRLWAGMRFRVGPFPLRVTRLGRYRNSGDVAEHEVRLYRSDGRLLNSTRVQASNDTDHVGFNYGAIPPLVLKPDTEYILVSREGGRDRFADEGTVVTPRAGDLSVVGSVWSTDASTFHLGSPNHSYGAVSFQYGD